LSFLNESYSRASFQRFVSEFLPDYVKDERTINFESKIFQYTFYLGRSSSLNIPVYEVHIDEKLEARVSITKNAFRMMRILQDYKALIIFKDRSSNDWRLSYSSILPVIKDGKITEEFSNPRRFSYLLGEQSKINTAYNFLIKKGQVADLADLESRFSVEVVNDDFYRRIASLFDELVGTSEIKGDLVHPGNGEIKQQFVVRLIGRILFCWFLSEKKDESGIPLVSKSLLSSRMIDETTSYLDEVLNKLFFEVLNTPSEERISLHDDFLITPFLNGGLFSPRYEDFYSRNYSPKSSVVKVPNSWLKKLFELFEIFNFTVDENSSVDVELSIDPEMLGRIFENLLARLDPMTGETIRSLTGSFYTPREIVDRMVDSALMTYLQGKSGIGSEKIKALFTYDLVDDTIHPLSLDEKTLLVRLISEMTVLDPACGSGAFPIGALQRILFVLGRLDPEAKIWFDNQFKDLSPELRQIVLKELKSQNFDYVRKLTAIRSNIFGVDIQPIAAEIAKLRCFLTLVVEQDVHAHEPNRGVHILPNLEFKFVTANSLLPLHESEGLFGDEIDLIEKIQEIRSKYFATESSKTKEALHQKFVKLLKDQKTSLWESSRLEQIKSFRPFDSESSADFFEPDFMFGVREFDVIVGNPPYIDSQVMVKTMEPYRNELRQHYDSATGNWDLFVVFLEKSMQLLRPNGVMSMIVKNQLIGANYATQIRKILSANTVDMILDYSEVNVFKSASVYPVIIQVTKNKKRHPVNIEIFLEGLDNPQVLSIPTENFYSQDVWGSFFASNQTQDFISLFPETKKLESLPFVSEVASAGPTNEAYIFKEYVREFNPRTDKEGTYKRFINTGTVDPFMSLWGIKKCRYLKDDYMNPVVAEDDIIKVNKKRLEIAERPKIIVGGMSKRIEAFLDIDGSYMPGKSTFYISIDDTKNIGNLKYLAGLLNSDLLAYWFAETFTGLKMAGGYLRISHKELRKIPVVMSSKKHFDKVVELVDQLTSVATSEDLRIELTKNLNSLVLEIYGIPEEIWAELSAKATA
jgi:adenine-specific DNA-methyltransferase